MFYARSPNYVTGLAMPCHTRMKIILLKGILWLYLWGFSILAASLEPGFLDFDNLPDTNFSCVGKVIGGYYADLETSCQMFHVCTIGQLDEPMDIRFLCLNGTVFDQETRVCERIDEVDCSKSEQFYSLNLELYGNTQPPILEDTPDTDPPDILKHPASTTTTTTTTQRPTKPKTTRPSFIITTTQKPPPSSTPLEDKFLQSHHFHGSNSADIRFNPEEINISLNPGAPPNIRQKPVSFQQSISDNNKRVIVTTHTTVYKNENSNKPPVISTMSPQVVDTQKNNYDAFFSGGYQTERNVDYETEIPHHEISFRPSFRPSSRDIEQHYSPKPSTYRTQYHPTTISPVRINYSQRGPTTYRNSYSSPLKPALPYYHRTDKPPRIQLPLPLIPTLSPLTFSSPAPFSLNRHVEAKRFADHHQPPRIVISASASVSDASGRKFNYSLGTIGDSRFFGQAPHSYDDYKEDDVGLDPFYHDVPKLKRSHYMRNKRSVPEENVTTASRKNIRNKNKKKPVKNEQNRQAEDKNNNSNTNKQASTINRNESNTNNKSGRKLTKNTTNSSKRKSNHSRRSNSRTLLQKQLENNSESEIERPSSEHKRAKRKDTPESSPDKRAKREPEDDEIKSEKEAIEVLKFLFNWYNSHEKVSEPSIPIKPETITEINKELKSNYDSDYYYEDYDITTKYDIQRSTPKSNENYNYERTEFVVNKPSETDNYKTSDRNAKANLQILKPPHLDVQFNISEGVVSITEDSNREVATQTDGITQPHVNPNKDNGEVGSNLDGKTESNVEYEYVDDNYEADTYNYTATEKPVVENIKNVAYAITPNPIGHFVTKGFEVRNYENNGNSDGLRKDNSFLRNGYANVNLENVSEDVNEPYENVDLVTENGNAELEIVTNKDIVNSDVNEDDTEDKNKSVKPDENIEHATDKEIIEETETESIKGENENSEIQDQHLRNKETFESSTSKDFSGELQNAQSADLKNVNENISNQNENIENYESAKNVKTNDANAQIVNTNGYKTQSEGIQELGEPTLSPHVDTQKSDRRKSRRRNFSRYSNTQEVQEENNYTSRTRNSNRRRNNTNQRPDGEAKSRRRNHNRQNDYLNRNDESTRENNSSKNNAFSKEFNERNKNEQTAHVIDSKNTEDFSRRIGVNEDLTTNSHLELTTNYDTQKIAEEQTNNYNEFTITENYTPTSEPFDTTEDTSKYVEVLKILGVTTNKPIHGTFAKEDSFPYLTPDATTTETYDETTLYEENAQTQTQTDNLGSVWTITQKGITELEETEATAETLASTTERKFNRRNYNQSKRGNVKKYMKSDELKKLEQYGSTITTENYFSTTSIDDTTRVDFNDYGIYSKEYKNVDDVEHVRNNNEHTENEKVANVGNVDNIENVGGFNTETTSTEPALYTTVQLQEFIDKIESNTNSIADTRNLTDTTIEITTVDLPTTENQITTVETTTPNLDEISNTFVATERLPETTTQVVTTFFENPKRNNRRRGGHRFSITTSEKPQRRKPSITEEIVDVIKNRMDSDSEQSTRRTHRKKIQDFNINAYTANLAYRNRKTETTQIPDFTSVSFAKSVNPTVAKTPKDLLPTTPLSKSKGKGNFTFNCFGKIVNKFYSDPRDCRLFHYCTRGFTKTQLLDMKFVCDLGTYFDSEKLICTKDKPVSCT